jgi:hypothetical protein
MTPVPRFSTVPLPRCEETDIMVRKDAILRTQQESIVNLIGTAQILSFEIP